MSNEQARGPPSQPDVVLHYDHRADSVYFDVSGRRICVPFRYVFPDALRGEHNPLVEYMAHELAAGLEPKLQARFAEPDFELILRRHFM